MAFEKASPRPWRVVDKDEIYSATKLLLNALRPDCFILPKAKMVEGKRATLPTIEECDANTLLIVHAVNMHAELIAAARLLVEAQKFDKDGVLYPSLIERACTQFRALLAKEDAQ